MFDELVPRLAAFSEVMAAGCCAVEGSKIAIYFIESTILAVIKAKAFVMLCLEYQYLGNTSGVKILYTRNRHLPGQHRDKMHTKKCYVFCLLVGVRFSQSLGEPSLEQLLIHRQYDPYSGV